MYPMAIGKCFVRKRGAISFLSIAELFWLGPLARPYADGLGVVLQGIVFHARHVAQKACPQSQEFFKIELHVSSH